MPEDKKSLLIEVADMDGITFANVFNDVEMLDLANTLSMFSDDQAWQVVSVITEMLRRIECRKQGLNY